MFVVAGVHWNYNFGGAQFPECEYTYDVAVSILNQCRCAYMHIYGLGYTSFKADTILFYLDA